VAFADTADDAPPAAAAAGRGSVGVGVAGGAEADPPDDTCGDDSPLPDGFAAEPTGADEPAAGLPAEVVEPGTATGLVPPLAGLIAAAEWVAAAGVAARLAVPPPVTALDEDPEAKADGALAGIADIAAVERDTDDDDDDEGGGTGALGGGTVDDVLLIGRDAADWGGGGGDVGWLGGGAVRPPDAEPPAGAVEEEDADVGIGFWVMGAVPTARLGLDV
jgi:hypothetical protein